MRAAVACVAVMGMSAGETPRIPLVKDLTIWRAQRGGPTQGDYEGSIRVDAVDDQSVTLVSSALHVDIDTRMARTTMRDARTYREVWTTADPEVITGATSMMVSSALLNELATKGSTKMTIIPNTGSGKSGSMLDQMGVIAKAVFSDSTSTGTPYTGTLRRIEPAAVPFTLLINGHPSSVAAIHARGMVVAEGDSMNIELYVLDDPSLPIVLQSGAVGGEGGRVIKITYPDSTSSSSSPASGRPRSTISTSTTTRRRSRRSRTSLYETSRTSCAGIPTGGSTSSDTPTALAVPEPATWHCPLGAPQR